MTQLITPEAGIVRPHAPAIISPPGLRCPPRFKAQKKRATMVQPMRRGHVGEVDTGFELTFVDSDGINSTQDNYTHSNMPLGDDVAGGDVRYTIVCCGLQGNLGVGFFQNGTIGGAATALVNDGSTDAQANDGAAVIFMMYANTTGMGTSATIYYKTDGLNSGSGIIAIYRLINPSSIQAYDVRSTLDETSGVSDVSLNIPSGGLAIGAMQGRAVSTSTWDGLVETVDLEIDSTDYFSSALGGSPGTPHTVTYTNADTTPAQHGVITASWGP